MHSIEPFRPALTDAINLCSLRSKNDIEEQGGWIVGTEDKPEFYQLTNVFSGQLKAHALFQASRSEIGKKILPVLNKPGYKNLATFHTHPRFTCSASMIDFSILFNVAPTNFIFTPVFSQLSEYVYESKTKWIVRVYDVDTRTSPYTFIISKLKTNHVKRT